ncbi:hypothetical protein SALBM311S_09269 [Streptomyces alboniger]
MDLDTFRKLAIDRRVIPVTRKLLADGDTPVALYRKLAAERPGTFLLESAENGRTAFQWSRYSFVGVRSAATLTARDGQAHWLGTPPVGVPVDGDPLAALRATIEALHTPHQEGLPPFTGGMVGYLGYDIVRRLEKIGPGERDDLRLPELTMLLTSDLAVMDHWEGSVLLIANAINHNDLATGVDEAYHDAVARLDAMEADLSRPVAQPPAVLPPSELPEYTALWGGPDFQEAVEDVKERIRAGEAFQVVPSQRFETPCTASALDVYRVLRATNPSPYMYLFRLDGFDIVGSSPEALVKADQPGHYPVLPAAALHRPVLPWLWRATQRARLRPRGLPDGAARQCGGRHGLSGVRRPVDRLGGARRARAPLADRSRPGARLDAGCVAAGLLGCPEPAVRWLAPPLIKGRRSR